MPILKSEFYEYIVSNVFRAVVATNAGPLTLPGIEACSLANHYSRKYPGSEFYTACSGAKLVDAYIKTYIYLPIDPANSGGLDWSILSKLKWLERLADNPSMLSWLSENCRQS